MDLQHVWIAYTVTIDLCLAHFKGLSLTHLEAAWFSVCQNLPDLRVRKIHVLDNASGAWPLEVREMVWIPYVSVDEAPKRGHVPPWGPGFVPVLFEAWQHPDPAHTHAWSVNMLCRHFAYDAEWILFTRSDYLLAFDALARMAERALTLEAAGHKPFVTGWCWQMGIDANLSNTDAPVDLEQYGWRTSARGVDALLQHPYGVRFHDTALDAGVWLTKRAYLEEAGWMNEALTAWGYSQSVFQRALMRVGVTCEAIPDYLFAHQHHAADRDFRKASDEYRKFGGGV